MYQLQRFGAAAPPVNRKTSPRTSTPLSLRKIFTAGTLLAAAGRSVAAPVQQPMTTALSAPDMHFRLNASETRFAVIGDYGFEGKAEKRVADMLKSWQPEFVATTGDNNYPSGAAATFDKNVGQYFHKFITFDHRYKGAYSLHGAPENNFFPALGNHDWMTKKARPHLQTFELPGNRRFYNVRRGNVELFVVDSDPSEPKGVNKKSKQAKWLKGALAKSTAKWKVVTMHHAPYSNGHHGSNVWMQWPFERWGASVVIAGHDHFYERIILDGFPYFVNGVGGAPLDPRPQHANIPGATEDVIYAERHGALRVHADERSMLFCFYNDKRTLIDSYLMPDGGHKASRRACESA